MSAIETYTIRPLKFSVKEKTGGANSYYVNDIVGSFIIETKVSEEGIISFHVSINGKFVHFAQSLDNAKIYLEDHRVKILKQVCLDSTSVKTDSMYGQVIDYNKDSSNTIINKIIEPKDIIYIKKAVLEDSKLKAVKHLKNCINEKKYNNIHRPLGLKECKEYVDYYNSIWYSEKMLEQEAEIRNVEEKNELILSTDPVLIKLFNAIDHKVLKNFTRLYDSAILEKDSTTHIIIEFAKEIRKLNGDYSKSVALAKKFLENYRFLEKKYFDLKQFGSDVF